MAHPTTFFIRPKLGLTLRDPATDTLLPAGGAVMPRSAFWLRRQKDGDVEVISEPTPAAPDPDAKGKKKE